MKTYLTIACLLLAATPARSQSISQKAESAMRRVFGADREERSVLLTLDAATHQEAEKRSGQTIGNKVIVHEALADGKIVGYGIVDDVRGKAQPITYMTLIRPDASVAEVEVLVYREPYGGEVQNESYRKQFRGKRSKAPLCVGQDIQNIAGATISSKAIANGVRKILVLFEVLKHAGKI